ncbi:hypothetical protein FRB99_002005 [Tulasnella sp. 403]|nr:hypothetical protein FRB99_002005 [Tulasnella sp. 403]
MRQYVERLDTFKRQAKPLNLQAELVTEDILRDLTKASNLLRTLYTQQHHQSQSRNLDVENQLLDLMTRLHAAWLPDRIRGLASSFRPARDAIYASAHSIQDLTSAYRYEIPEMLEIVPPQDPSKRRQWETNARLQRRKSLSDKATASFQAVLKIEKDFTSCDRAISDYLRSLPLLEAPRHVPPDYRKSNETMEDFIRSIDEFIPKLYELVMTSE